ncbi:12481_t:CDS:1, partial [Acaulospora morrowiae]
ELFIDRDGTIFVHILDFLRTSTLPNLSLPVLRKLEIEAKFYEIKPLQTFVAQRIQEYVGAPKFKIIPIRNFKDDEWPQFFINNDMSNSLCVQYGYQSREESVKMEIKHDDVVVGEKATPKRLSPIPTRFLSIVSDSADDDTLISSSSVEVPIIYHNPNIRNLDNLENGGNDYDGFRDGFGSSKSMHLEPHMSLRNSLDLNKYLPDGEIPIILKNDKEWKRDEEDSRSEDQITPEYEFVTITTMPVDKINSSRHTRDSSYYDSTMYE